jgi:hypothetical protein
MLAAGSIPYQTLILGSYQVLSQVDFYQLLYPSLGNFSLFMPTQLLDHLDFRLGRFLT